MILIVHPRCPAHRLSLGRKQVGSALNGSGVGRHVRGGCRAAAVMHAEDWPEVGGKGRLASGTKPASSRRFRPTG